MGREAYDASVGTYRSLIDVGKRMRPIILLPGCDRYMVRLVGEKRIGRSMVRVTIVLVSLGKYPYS